MVELQNKGRWRRKLWILLSCGIALVLLFTLLRKREPRYQGRSLSQWIALFRGGYAYEPDISLRDTEEAIRHIGTNGLPTLLKWLNYRERPLQSRLGSLCNKLPEKVASPLSRLFFGRGEERQQDAFSALYALGAEAKPAIPALTNLFTSQPQLADQCMAALVYIGDEGLSQVLCVFTNPASPVRASATQVLANPQANYAFNQGVADILTSCLDDADPLVAFRSAAILCARRVNQERAIRTFVAAIEGNDKRRKQEAGWFLPDVLRRFDATNVIQLLQDTNSPLSPYAASALGHKFQDSNVTPPIVLSALTNSLCDPRPLVRSYAANALGRLSNAAEPYVAALLGLWTDPDETVRQSATNAFFELPSYRVLTRSGLPLGMSQEQAEMYERRYGIKSLSSAELTNLLNHPDTRVRKMATNALQTLRNSNVVNQTSENANR